MRDGGAKPSAAHCARAAHESLNAELACAPAPQAECGFNGAWCDFYVYDNEHRTLDTEGCAAAAGAE